MAFGDFTVTRASTKNVLGSAGLYVSVANDTPAFEFNTDGSYRGLLVEPGATNQIRNNSATGAVVGAPGTLPTNWTVSAFGLSSEVVALGTVNGIDYIDIRISGTSTSTTGYGILPDSVTQIIASNGQIWTGSVWIQILSEPNPANSYKLRITERQADGTPVGTISETDFTNLFQRVSLTKTLSGGASTERVNLDFRMGITNGNTYDFTVRIGWPQMETGSVATSPIATAGSTVARSADVVSLTGASSLIGQTRGAFYAEFEYRDIPIVRSGPLYIRQALVRGLGISFAPGGAGLQVVSRNNAGQTAITIVAGALQIGTLYKVAVVYDAGATALGGTQVNGITCFVNGVSVATGDFRVPDTALLNEVRLYGSNTGAGADIDPFNGSIRSVALFPTTITSSQAISITTL